MRLIDADALIANMEERKKIWLSQSEYNDAIRLVNEEPTVEPNQGEWKYKRNGIFCPICDKGWEYCKVPSDLQDYNFCPNCGARMKEGDEK